MYPCTRPSPWPPPVTSNSHCSTSNYTRQKRNAYSETYQFFWKTASVITILFLSFQRHATDCYSAHLSFIEIKDVFNKIGFKPDEGEFVKSLKNCVFIMLSLRIKLSNANHLYRPKSSQRVVLWDSHLIFDLTQSSTVGEPLLCDYPMVLVTYWR